MSETPIALITGANKGIGYEIAAGLGALGMTVAVAARDEARRQAAVQRLTAGGADAFGVALDVTDDASVQQAAQTLTERFGRLDVLVNNAGILGSFPQQPSTIDLEVIRTVLETNVFGVIRVTNALLPLLRRSRAPRIVNLTSATGSLARQSGPDRATTGGPIAMAYSPSKTFLNAVTLQYAREFEGTTILVNLVSPGFVATDFNGHRGVRTPVEGARTAIRLATLPADGPTGGLFEDDSTLPW